MDRLLFGSTLFAALGSGIVSGVLFAFSTFVMKALGRLPPAQGVAAMQSINVTALGPFFMLAFMGTAVVSAALAVVALMRWRGTGAGLLLLGSVLYLLGVFVVTALFNVPRNDALAAVAPGSPEASALWTDYLRVWIPWNHVRTLAALAAAAAFILALVQLSAQVPAPLPR